MNIKMPKTSDAGSVSEVRVTPKANKSKHIQSDIKETVIQESAIEIDNMIDEWCKSNANGCSGGEMRDKRGSDIEKFVRATVNKIGKLSNINLLKSGYHIGIDTVGQSLRNANLQMRSEPPNPQLNTGPWNQTTITPDFQRVPLEIGSGSQ